MSYDAVARHKVMENLVTRNISGIQEKKYYRWRVDRWYGGIVTADVVGCGLYCKFCWVSDSVLNNPSESGEFHSPIDVADRLVRLLKKSGFKQLRISGGEPAIGQEHLLALLELFQDQGYQFILETNGILLGHDKTYADSLSKYDFLHVRVSLKGCSEDEFASLTNANPDGFELQINALKNLIDSGVICHPSVMTLFSTGESLDNLRGKLSNISQKFAIDLEIEELILYPKVIQRLRKYGIRPTTS